MAFLTSLREHLDIGDPTVRSWFLIRSLRTPFVLSALYMFFVLRLGPFLMQHRKPFDLRKTMIAYNFGIVAIYVSAVLVVVYEFLTTNCMTKVCSPTMLAEEDCAYVISSAVWFIYVIKIERTGFQVIPVVINSLVHIIMYTYYGLSAMGPGIQKFLWWKEYLTLLQMSQFVVILILMLVVAPMSGCNTSAPGMSIDAFFAALFLLMFYNFYLKTYKKPLRSDRRDEVTSLNDVNGTTDK